MCQHQKDCPCEGKYSQKEHDDFNKCRQEMSDKEEPWRHRQQGYVDSHRTAYQNTHKLEDLKTAERYEQAYQRY